LRSLIELQRRATKRLSGDKNGYQDVNLVKLLSVNVGSPRELVWQGKRVRTSIFKSPVDGRVRVTRLNLEGDQQSDLSVHGGVDKAVYAYPSEHYPFWRKELPSLQLAWGAFGENLTIEGLLEDAVKIGDRLRIGSTQFVVTQPRMPCFKLGIRLGVPDMVNRFLRSGRSGFYVAVLDEGEIAAGDAIELLTQDGQADPAVTVADVVSLYSGKTTNRDLLRRVSELPALPSSLRDQFRSRL
jgi:MOSC domain-containing protein YiiM